MDSTDTPEVAQAPAVPESENQARTTSEAMSALIRRDLDPGAPTIQGAVERWRERERGIKAALFGKGR